MPDPSENTNATCGVYRILNTSNGRAYVGSTKNAKNRKNDHFKMLRNGTHHSKHLQNAYNLAVDKSVFKFQLLLRCEEGQLIDTEQYFINFMTPEYNILQLAGRTTGYKHTEETRSVLSEKSKNQKNRNFSVMIEANRGRPKSAAHKAKTGLANRGRKPSESAIRNSVSARLGKPSWNKDRVLTKNHREKLSDAKKGWPTIRLSWYNTSVRHQNYWGA